MSYNYFLLSWIIVYGTLMLLSNYIKNLEVKYSWQRRSVRNHWEIIYLFIYLNLKLAVDLLETVSFWKVILELQGGLGKKNTESSGKTSVNRHKNIFGFKLYLVKKKQKSTRRFLERISPNRANNIVKICHSPVLYFFPSLIKIK